jgi:hypothetical protein
MNNYGSSLPNEQYWNDLFETIYPSITSFPLPPDANATSLSAYEVKMKYGVKCAVKSLPYIYFLILGVFVMDTNYDHNNPEMNLSPVALECWSELQLLIKDKEPKSPMTVEFATELPIRLKELDSLYQQHYLSKEEMISLWQKIFLGICFHHQKALTAGSYELAREYYFAAIQGFTSLFPPNIDTPVTTNKIADVVKNSPETNQFVLQKKMKLIRFQLVLSYHYCLIIYSEEDRPDYFQVEKIKQIIEDFKKDKKIPGIDEYLMTFDNSIGVENEGEEELQDQKQQLEPDEDGNREVVAFEGHTSLSSGSLGDFALDQPNDADITLPPPREDF